MRWVYGGLLISLFLIVGGCKLPTEFFREGEVDFVYVEGEFSIPISPLEYSNLVIDAAERVSVFPTGTFVVRAFDGFWQSYDIYTKDGKFVFSIYDTAYNGIKITPEKVAMGIIFNIPVSWTSIVGGDPGEVMKAFESHPKWNDFVDMIETLLRNDLYGIYDWEKHPQIKEMLKEIIRDVIETYTNEDSARVNVFDRGAYIDPTSCSDGDNTILIRNPTNIEYGIAAYNMSMDPLNPDAYKRNLTSYLNPQWIWGRGIGILDIIFDSEEEDEYVL